MSGGHNHHHGPESGEAAYEHEHGDGHDHDAHDHGQRHSHGHSHGSGHHHHHAPVDFGPRFAIGALLNTGFVIAEALYGLFGHSLALLADAGHNLGDVLALLVAWGAASLAKRAPSARYTYGLGSTSMLAALFNAVVLLVITGGVVAEAIRRLLDPEPVGGATIMAVAAAGIVVNGVTAWMFASGRKGDINVRGAFQHMLSDAVVSAGVVVAGGLVLLTGWEQIDPITSLVVSALIVWGTWGLLKDSLDMVLDAVPPGIDPNAVRAWLSERPGVADLHDLHIWPMSTTETALTVHLVMPQGHPGDAALMDVCKGLRERFRIGHATVQVEIDTDTPCALQPAHVV